MFGDTTVKTLSQMSYIGMENETKDDSKPEFEIESLIMVNK